MRLTLVLGDHAAHIRGIPKGISPEALSDYCRVIRAELIALYDGGPATRTEIVVDDADQGS